MATSEEPSQKDFIEFTLKAKASRTSDSIEFALDLNPNVRQLSIAHSFSTLPELKRIFNDILRTLSDIKERTELYNSTISIDAKFEELFYEGYERNVRREFEKIDKVIFDRYNPSISTVSYANSYNGDKRP
jgi:hypothetical protein